jgi:hypothetical protein
VGPTASTTGTAASFARSSSRLTFQQALFESVTARDEHRGGWSECFDHLADHLAGS